MPVDSTQKHPRLNIYKGTQTSVESHISTIKGEETTKPALSLAYYADTLHTPQTISFPLSQDVRKTIEQCISKIGELLEQLHSRIPLEAVQEITENFIHAEYEDALISVCDEGQKVVFSDHGPGIADKDNARLPGFSTASRYEKHFIKGIGSGLTHTAYLMGAVDGALKIEDNLGQGSVITLIAPGSTDVAEETIPLHEEAPLDMPFLNQRQREVLLFCAQGEEVGPSTICNLLGIPLSTAHRDLTKLQELNLLETTNTGKRTLSNQGRRIAENL